jgi:hypothetical protein
MAMSKRKIELLSVVLILGIVFIPFFIYKAFMLSDYYKYSGKIKGIEGVNVSYPGFKSKGGSELKNIPIVEYYTKKDTSSFSEGTLNYFSFYNKGDEVTVLERKDDPYKTHIYSFWYYYLLIPELITLLLICMIIFAICRVYITKTAD